MKSPVAQNLKIVCNINRKGKRGKIALACNCCWIVCDIPDKERDRMARKEMREEVNTYYYGER